MGAGGKCIPHSRGEEETAMMRVHRIIQAHCGAHVVGVEIVGRETSKVVEEVDWDQGTKVWEGCLWFSDVIPHAETCHFKASIQERYHIQSDLLRSLNQLSYLEWDASGCKRVRRLLSRYAG